MEDISIPIDSGVSKIKFVESNELLPKWYFSSKTRAIRIIPTMAMMTLESVLFLIPSIISAIMPKETPDIVATIILNPKLSSILKQVGIIIATKIKINVEVMH